MYTIKEASEKLGCPAHTIRYYEKEGLLPYIRRDEYGNRIFEKKDLDWMRLMTCFRATGMKVTDLKKIVELALQGESTIGERKAILEAHQEELKRKQLLLNQAFEAVNHKLEVYNKFETGNPEDKFLMNSEE